MTIFAPPAHSSGGYQITNSVRLRAAASAYFSRTPAAGNRKTWSLSLWVKRSAMAGGQLFAAYVDGTNYTYAAFESDALRWSDTDAGANTTLLITTQLFRDPSAWYHLLFVNDTSTASGQTADNRRRIYVNGVQVTSFSSRTNPAADYEGHWNKAVLHKLGVGIATYFDGYLAKNEAVEGFKTGTTTANAADFGETNSDGVWVPKVYTGTYGTNGFHLDFKDAALTAGSNAGLGKDVSGNGNYWTTNNISVTAGVTYDSMVDTPTNNYATLNPIIASAANISYAALRSGTTAVQATMDAGAFSTSGAYWEVTAGASAVTAGVISATGTTNTTTVTANKVFGFRLTSADALDYINITDAGSWTSITTGLTGERYPYGVTQAADWNFGQRPFIGTASGQALCTANLQPPVAPTASGSFTGNAAADGPFVWIGGVPSTLTINSNAVTFGTHADKTAGGFKLRTASASYNTAGANTWTATFASPSTKSAFAVPQTAQGNP